MSSKRFRLLAAVIPAAFTLLAAVVGLLARVSWSSPPKDDPQVAAARQLVAHWADRLDHQTTDTGVYIRHPADTLPDDDPWGRPLRVLYTQGGLAEQVTVRSFGPDGREYTADDILTARHAVNLKGVGEGVRKNAEETAHHTAKGLVKGFVDGTKESIRGGNR